MEGGEHRLFHRRKPIIRHILGEGEGNVWWAQDIHTSTTCVWSQPIRHVTPLGHSPNRLQQMAWHSKRSHQPCAEWHVYLWPCKSAFGPISPVCIGTFVIVMPIILQLDLMLQDYRGDTWNTSSLVLLLDLEIGVVIHLHQQRLFGTWRLLVFKGMNTESLCYLTSA
jgi:hypothetical protein